MEKDRIQVYLLPVKELFCCGAEHMAEGTAQALPGWEKLTARQQERVSRCRQEGALRLCLGGQLLLQYGAHRAAEDVEQAFRRQGKCGRKRSVGWQMLTGEQLLSGIPAPLPLEIGYGNKGKPYIMNLPWHYNLSHSGEYVALAMSGASVGIDIQRKGAYSHSMVKRFFSPQEAEAFEGLSRCGIPEAEDAEDLFYTLWCRKEAYGKLMGTGLTEDVLKRNMLEDTEVFFREYQKLPGYCICVCCQKGWIA